MNHHCSAASNDPSVRSSLSVSLLAVAGAQAASVAVKFYHPPTNIDPAREGKWVILRVHLPQPAEKWPVMSSTLSLLSIGEVPCCCLTLSYCIFCQPGLRIIIDPYLLLHPWINLSTLFILGIPSGYVKIDIENDHRNSGFFP